MTQGFTMGVTLSMLSEQDRHELRRVPRRSVQEGVALRMIVENKAILASGQVIDMTTRGCGLRLTKPLTFKVYPNDGTACVQCDVAQVPWVEADRAGVVFLWMLREHARRLRQFCDDRLVFEVED
jgi:hypothetical protein